MKKYLFGLLILMPAFSMAQAKTWKEPGKDFICHGGHPRCAAPTGRYRYHQFGMQPGIGDFAGFSDVLHAGPTLIQYQTFLTELETYRPNTNAVASWSDAMARVNDSLVWGSFVSARSQLDAGSDAQLIGQEIDVLNDGKPGIAPNKSKVGLQIVGFGRQNTNAIEVLNQSPTSGQFSNGIVFGPTALAGDGAYLGATSAKPVARGIDFQNVHFTDGAMMLSQGSAITFANRSGEKSAILTDDSNQLVVRAGESGLRVIDSTSRRDLMTVTPAGDMVTPYGSFAKMRSDVDALQAASQVPAVRRLLLPLALIASMLVNVVAIGTLIGTRRRAVLQIQSKL